MAVQNINTELISRAQAAVEALEEMGIKKLRAGIEEAVEIAKESGSPKLISNMNSFEESSNEVLKAMEEVYEILSRMVTEYKKLDEVL